MNNVSTIKTIEYSNVSVKENLTKYAISIILSCSIVGSGVWVFMH